MFGCGLHQRLHSNIKIALAICCFTALSLVCNIFVDSPRKSKKGSQMNWRDRRKEVRQRLKNGRKAGRKNWKKLADSFPAALLICRCQRGENTIFCIKSSGWCSFPYQASATWQRDQGVKSTRDRQIKETYKTISCQQLSMSTEFINKKDLNKSPVISLLVQWLRKQENHLPNVISGYYYYYS